MFTGVLAMEPLILPSDLQIAVHLLDQMCNKLVFAVVVESIVGCRLIILWSFRPALEITVGFQGVSGAGLHDSVLGVPAPDSCHVRGVSAFER